MQHHRTVSVASLVACGFIAMSVSMSAQSKKPESRRVAEAEQSSGENLDEAILGAKIRMALLKSLKGADGMRIEVTVTGQDVVLAGEVHDRASMKLASEVVKAVEGVRNVKSTLTLDPKSPKQDSFSAQVNDATLVTEVRLALLEQIGAEAFSIHVAAASGVVSLRGELPSKEERERALKTVNAISSVKRVENLIDVKK
jgi:hyperosmotically inducible protein